MACIFNAASTINYIEWTPASHTYQMCFIKAFLLQSIMNLVSGVCLSRVRCANWMSGMANNKPFILSHKVNVDQWYETAHGRKEEKGVVNRSSRNVHTLCEVPRLCDKVWRARKGRLRVQGNASATEVVPTWKREVGKEEGNGCIRLRIWWRAHFLCSGPALDKRMDYLTSQTAPYILGIFLAIYILNWSKSYHLTIRGILQWILKTRLRPFNSAKMY